MRQLIRGTIFLLNFSLLLYFAVFNCRSAELEDFEQAQSGKTITVEATVTLSGPQPTTLPAGYNDAHVVGLGQRTGNAVFSDGRKAEYILYTLQKTGQQMGCCMRN